MQTLKLYLDNIIVGAVLLLNEVKGRRIITWNEIQLFITNLKQKASSKGFELFVNSYDVDWEEFANYFDEIDFEGQKIYRLKPVYDIDDEVRRYFVRGLSTDGLILIFDKSLVSNLNDFDKDSERSISAFQKIDEKYQLETMYKLFELEKAKRKLEENLSVSRKNASLIVDDLLVEEFLENNPYISTEGLLESFEKNQEGVYKMHYIINYDDIIMVALYNFYLTRGAAACTKEELTSFIDNLKLKAVNNGYELYFHGDNLNFTSYFVQLEGDTYTLRDNCNINNLINLYSKNYNDDLLFLLFDKDLLEQIIQKTNKSR